MLVTITPMKPNVSQAKAYSSVKYFQAKHTHSATAWIPHSYSNKKCLPDILGISTQVTKLSK
jgi:hypothetical protein